MGTGSSFQETGRLKRLPVSVFGMLGLARFRISYVIDRGRVHYQPNNQPALAAAPCLAPSASLHWSLAPFEPHVSRNKLKTTRDCKRCPRTLSQRSARTLLPSSHFSSSSYPYFKTRPTCPRTPCTYSLLYHHTIRYVLASLISPPRLPTRLPRRPSRRSSRRVRPRWRISPDQR